MDTRCLPKKDEKQEQQRQEAEAASAKDTGAGASSGPAATRRRKFRSFHDRAHHYTTNIDGYMRLFQKRHCDEAQELLDNGHCWGVGLRLVSVCILRDNFSTTFFGREDGLSILDRRFAAGCHTQFSFSISGRKIRHLRTHKGILSRLLAHLQFTPRIASAGAQANGEVK